MLQSRFARSLCAALVALTASFAGGGGAAAADQSIVNQGWFPWEAGAARAPSYLNITAVTLQVGIGHGCVNARDASTGATYSPVCGPANSTPSKPFCGCASRQGFVYSDQVTGYGPNGQPQSGGVYSFGNAWQTY
jgi:hypothetical protein